MAIDSSVEQTEDDEAAGDRDDRLEAVFDGSGAYRRDEGGCWRYTVGGDEVPGATDAVLGSLYHPQEADDGEHFVVPRHWVRLRPGHPLSWVEEFSELGSREPYLVPIEVWRANADAVVGMLAPELHPAQLLGIDEVAAVAGVSEVTIRAYLHRRQMPQPAVRIAGSPAWPRPVIERWLARRRARRTGSAGAVADD